MSKANDHGKKEIQPPPVVAIGASAGGIEALQQFFPAIPDDLGLAYVVVVHLAPDRESELPEILQRCTSMQVEQVGDHETVKLEPNRVYVIAPDRKLEITDTSIGASRFEQPRGQRAAIDLFFRSLAARHGDGFAIVMSGSGSDGALGARAVKDSGGLVLVQDPREASHEGMPRAVISTGVADVVLPIRKLAERLIVLARSKRKVASTLRTAGIGSATDEDEERILRAMLELLRKRTGHDFSKYKRGTVLRRLARRMQLCHTVTLSDYFDYLRENVEETQALFDDLLIRVTTFFRDPEAWDALQGRVIAPLVDRADHDEPIRCWVPGCATGEEAYSLAILLQEEIDRRRTSVPVTIFASDVDESALAMARHGVFPDAISADVSATRLDRYFKQQDHHYRVASSIRDQVVFASHSLLRDPPFSRLHLVSCRNLLIYLDRQLQEQVMSLFQYACRPGGHLFLGVSEAADEQLFRPVDRKHRIFQLQQVPGGGRPALPTLLAAPRALLRPEREPRSPPRLAAAALHLDALEAVAPPSLVVDREWNVVHLSNSASRFLRQRGGPIARQVTDVVRPDLRDEVHLVLQRAFEDSAEQHASQFVPVQFNGTPRQVAVIARRHRQADGDGDYVLLTFLEAGEAMTKRLPGAGEPCSDVVGGLREKLRQAELRAESMRDDYHLANEDLRAANEELQSLNEEYRSTTEELETSKEELQSINEELQTVNHELKSKVEALSQANDDLENLMAATNIPVLFLDAELRIKRFTPQVADLFNVTSRDYGRPISDFTHNLLYDSLSDDARAVLAGGSCVDREIESSDMRSFLLRVSPYRTSGESPDGIVLTFVDVSNLKHAEAELRESEEQFRALVEASAQIVWRLDASGNVSGDSPSWQAYTGQAAGEWATSWLNAVHEKDREEADAAWRRAVENGQPLSAEFRLYHAPSDSYRWTTVRAVPLRNRDGGVRGWIGMHIDVNEYREAEQALREADQRKDEFLAMLGHELRNPLAAIRSSIEVHNAADGGESVTRRAWNIVDRQSSHMISMINDLLDVVRIDRGKLRLERSVVDLNSCIQETVEAMQPRIDAANLKLDVELYETPLYVYADAERLVQMLDNLLRNAVNYTDTGGGITIRAWPENDHAKVTVRDTGVGLEAAQIDALFEPYRQADPGRSGRGLGLGLTLVRHLVELHEGTVTARSGGRGKGSEFELTIPLTAEPPIAALGEIALPPPRHVLVVDDDADVADMFAGVLRNLGQNVEVAYDGEQALALCRTKRPEVAFVDLSMPGIDDHELARRLRDCPGLEDLCLVALSGYSLDMRGKWQNFDRHLLKPASVESIVELLRSLHGNA